jgi:predicted MFS family arabinose efflux permease
VGLAAALLPLVGVDGDAWRGLYAVGVIPLLLLAWLRRGLPETERFERWQASVQEPRLTSGPVRDLLAAYPARLALLSGVVFVMAAGGAAADFLSVKYLQQAHGWEPGQVSLLFLAGGVFALCGGAAAGWLSDRFGRRPAAVAFSAALSLLALAFYNGSGALLAALWVLMIFALLGHEALVATYGAELFATSHRTTAAGVRMLVGTAGAALGLAAESLLYAWLGSHWSAVSALLLLVFVGSLVIAVGFPETARRTLEEIAPERGSPHPDSP